MDETTNVPVPPMEPGDYYTVMAHFYRGELGRIMVWRRRLDVTTNWAIVSTTGIITFALGTKSHTPLIFPFANLLVFLLLSIESRRYRFYDAYRARVRMMEAHFIMPVVMRDTRMLQGDWRRVMSEDLVLPSLKMSRLTAILRRYRRNYFWIFAIILAAWFMKVWIHYPESHSVKGFIDALASSQTLSRPVFWGLFGSTYLLLGLLTVLAFVVEQESGEFASKAMHRKKWRI